MNTSYYDQCVAFALSQRGLQATQFEDTDWRVFHRQIANPGSIFPAMGKGGIVLPTVMASLLGREPDKAVSVVLLSANKVKNEVVLYNPMDDCRQTVDMAAFISSWHQSGGSCTTAFPPSNSTYTPHPIDLSGIQLPAGYVELQETIAENNHDVWATERQSEGWTYGPKRADYSLETPDMVPYQQLPESEKEYDRAMAINTLKLFLALGYDIVKRQ